MKAINYLLVFILSNSINVMGQSQIDIIDKSVNPGETLTEIPMEPLSTKGHYFLHDEWLVGNIYLKNNQSFKNIYKDEKVHPLPKNKNNLLALLIDPINKAEDFIKREKLRLNKENDLVKLVQLLNH